MSTSTSREKHFFRNGRYPQSCRSVKTIQCRAAYVLDDEPIRTREVKHHNKVPCELHGLHTGAAHHAAVSARPPLRDTNSTFPFSISASSGHAMELSHTCDL